MRLRTELMRELWRFPLHRTKPFCVPGKAKRTPETKPIQAEVGSTPSHETKPPRRPLLTFSPDEAISEEGRRATGAGCSDVENDLKAGHFAPLSAFHPFEEGNPLVDEVDENRSASQCGLLPSPQTKPKSNFEGRPGLLDETPSPRTKPKSNFEGGLGPLDERRFPRTKPTAGQVQSLTVPPNEAIPTSRDLRRSVVQTSPSFPFFVVSGRGRRHNVLLQLLGPRGAHSEITFAKEWP